MSLEHGNNFENPINQTEQNSDFLKSIETSISKLPSELQNLGKKEINKYKQIQAKTPENDYDLQDTIDAISSIESFKQLNDGYEEFINLLNNGNDLKDLYESILTRKDKIQDYIKNNGFPINGETLDAFNNKFGLNIKQSQIEQQTKVEEQQTKVEEQEKQVINKQKKSLIYIGNDLNPYKSKLDSNGIKLLDIISKLQNEEDIDKIKFLYTEVEILLNKQENLNQILTILQEIDNEKGIDSSSSDSVYKKFTSRLVEYNPDFTNKILAFENRTESNNKRNLTNSETARIYGGLGTDNPKIEGNIYINGDIMIDISKKPPERFIGDGSYKIETDLPIGDFYPAILKFERAKQKIEPKINSTDLLLQNTEYLEDLLNSNLDLVQIKTNLKNTLGIDTDFINSKSDLEVFNLKILKNNFSTELEKAEQDFKNELRNIIKLYHKSLEHKDKMTRETLKFLKSIGFDQIPQSITDNVINQLNLNTALRAKLGFTMEIDIKNGLLGTDSDANISSITSKEKADFARAFNIMISGEEDTPINLDAVSNDRGASISDMATFSAELDRTGLKDPGKANLLIMRNIREFGGEL